MHLELDPFPNQQYQEVPKDLPPQSVQVLLVALFYLDIPTAASSAPTRRYPFHCVSLLLCYPKQGAILKNQEK